MNYKIENDDIISFRLVESGLINSAYEGVEYQGTVSYATALAISPDINMKHQNLRAYFKDTYPDAVNASDYKYITVRHRNGVIEAIGEAWIVKNSLKVVNTQAKVIAITNWSEWFKEPIEDLLTRLGANYTIRDAE